MSKRWTLKEDRFLAAYFDGLGDYIGTHDLGRPKGAATKRVEKLKECGAWDILKLMGACDIAYRVAAFGPHEFIDDDQLEAVPRLISTAAQFYSDKRNGVLA